MSLPLSILDVIPVGEGQTPSSAIAASMRLVVDAEALGYSRYWFAEHHNMPTIASSAPEVLMTQAASLTQRIRIGAGGIMVPNHAPLHIAEVFKTLEALYPGRIDLGLGRAPGTDPLTASALGRAASERELNGKLFDLFSFANDAFPDDHPFASIVAQPSDVTFPTMWMLGSTSTGAAIAAQLGLGFAFAGHFNMAEADAAARQYHDHFQPVGKLEKAELIMAVSVICGEDDQHAQWLAGPYRVGIARMLTGRPGPLPTFEAAAAYSMSAMEKGALARFEHGAIIGGPATVAEKLAKLAERYRASELMLSTLIPDPAERLASIRRTAAATHQPATRD